jgi:hypothetical protein
MQRTGSRGPRGRLARGLALAVLGASGPANAGLVVSYEIESSTSSVHTSGGAGGAGIGDLAISGRFDFHLFDPIQSASIFENVAVSTSPASGFAFPEYVGFDILDNIGTLAQRGTQSNPLGLPDNTYTAVFDKLTHALEITGVYYEPVVGGLVYEYSLHTTVVPEPATSWLLAAGLIGLSGWRYRAARRDASGRPGAFLRVARRAHDAGVFADRGVEGHGFLRLVVEPEEGRDALESGLHGVPPRGLVGSARRAGRARPWVHPGLAEFGAPWLREDRAPLARRRRHLAPGGR